jgi:ABC-2 type transport system permease protein
MSAETVGPLNEVRVLAARNLRMTFNPTNLITTAISPLIFFVAFSVVLRRLLTERGVDFGQYFPPAIVVMSMGFTAMWTAFFLARDRGSGLAVRCRTLPIGRGALLGARLTADLVQSLCYLVVTLTAAFTIGFGFQNSLLHTVGFFLVALGFGFALSMGAAVLGLRSKDPATASSLLFLPFLPLQFFSTAYVRVQDFPGWLQPVVELSPFTCAVDALRALSTEGLSLAPVWAAAAWIVGLTVLFGVAAATAWRRVA